MYKSVNIDVAVEHLKNIVDNNRCAVCDNIRGTRVRYACGHTTCENCVSVAVDCSVCLTLPQATISKPVTDKPFTRRAVNTVNLLNAFQDEFHIDVYKRQRLSDQLKVEKEVFPKCIQAPVKYFNKRKSLNISIRKSNKENKLSVLPGEEISSAFDQKMDQSSKNVQRWLNNYVRKPFADLNSNDDRLRRDSSAYNKQKSVIHNENVHLKRSTRKRPNCENVLSIIPDQSVTDKYKTPLKKKKYYKNTKTENVVGDKTNTSNIFENQKNNKFTDKDSNGIVLDAANVIVTDNSQSMRVDKDMNAWLAVQEAEAKQYNSASIINSISSDKIVDIEKSAQIGSKTSSKIPFYKKGYLADKCIDCNNIYKDESKSYSIEPLKDVSITVENSSFTTIINITNILNKSKGSTKQSVEVQTDVTEPMIYSERNMQIPHIKLEHETKHIENDTILTVSPQSQDLFNHDRKILENINNSHNKKNTTKSVVKGQNVIIDESDSDEDLGASKSLEVTADVHRSCEEVDYEILAEIKNIEEHSKRLRRAARGFTPTSTDSSDKENYNPNRIKKPINSKKKTFKKR